jgi:hypothetical protein
MIPGHPYLSMIVPPEERIMVAGLLILVAAVVSYLMVKGIIRYADWRNTQIKEV